MEFIWIDDENARQESARNMARALEVEINFENVNGKDIDVELTRILEQYETPDLVIMDHILMNLSSGRTRNGSTAATRIKEAWSECPVVSVTNALDDNLHHVDTRQRDAYEEMFPGEDISTHYETIKTIANGFKVLKDNRPESVDDLLIKLSCPEEESERLKKILPNEIKIKENFEDRSLLIEIYKWFSSVFYKRPGFLYDELWTATYLGLTIDGFRSISQNFEKARYSGVFANDLEPRWWKCKLIQILAEHVDQQGLPWVIGRKLVDNSEFYSKDYTHDEDYPEIVAAEDETMPPNWYPMKLKYTEPHPGFENLLFFEELRVMKAD